MAESDHDIAAAMLANALVSGTGSRKLAYIEAAQRVDRQPDATGRALWRNVKALLRSPNPIPPYRGHFPQIPNPHAVHYKRIKAYATGGAVLSHGGDDDDDDDDKKITKHQARYRLGTEHRHCELCSMYRHPQQDNKHGDGSCT